MPEVLTFDRYPKLLTLAQVSSVLDPYTMVIAHEKVIGQTFRIMSHSGILTFGNATRKIRETNKRYQDCFDILKATGLDRFQMIRMPRFLVHGYFVGIGEGALRYPGKKYIITDIQNTHGNFLSYNNITQLAGILGHPVVPAMYRGNFEIRNIRNACHGSRLTVDHSDMGFILKTEPPSKVTFSDKTEDWCYVDLSRDVSGGMMMEATDVVEDLILTLKELPFTAAAIEEINKKLPPDLSHKKWLESVTNQYLEIFTGRYERVLFNYMEQLLDTAQYKNKNSAEIKTAVISEISRQFDKIGGHMYESNYKMLYPTKKEKKNADASETGENTKRATSRKVVEDGS